MIDDELKKKLIDRGYKGDFDILSLMRACGKRFIDLDIGHKPLWRARGLKSKGFFRKKEVVEGTGFFSREAIANLWLALQDY